MGNIKLDVENYRKVQCPHCKRITYASPGAICPSHGCPLDSLMEENES